MTVLLKNLGIFALLLQVLWTANPFPAGAQPLSETRYRVIASVFPPYSFEGNKRAEGLTVDGVRALFREIGLTPVIEVYPWARAFKTARETPDTFLFSVARTPERETMFTWVGPVMEFDVWVYRKRERADIDVKTLSDLYDYTFAGLIKDVKTTYLKGHGVYVDEVRSEDLAIKMLDAGRIDMIASDRSAMISRLSELGYDAKDFVPVLRLEALSKPLYLVAHPDTDRQLVERLRDALAQRERSGS